MLGESHQCDGSRCQSDSFSNLKLCACKKTAIILGTAVMVNLQTVGEVVKWVVRGRRKKRNLRMLYFSFGKPLAKADVTVWAGEVKNCLQGL